MSSFKKKSLFSPEVAVEVKEMLIGMVTDTAYNTNSSYSANAATYPDGVIPFVDKHMGYLNTHPSVDPWHYLANLRLMSRVR